MKVSDVMVACDTVECGYRIVELEDGRFAFVWGNIRAHVGDDVSAVRRGPGGEQQICRG